MRSELCKENKWFPINTLPSSMDPGKSSEWVAEWTDLFAELAVKSGVTPPRKVLLRESDPSLVAS